jgi:hypothetical protein
MMQKMGTNWQAMLDNGSPSELVAKVVLQAVLSKDPDLRYVAGKDIEGWLQARKGMAEPEFFGMIKQNLLGS